MSQLSASGIVETPPSLRDNRIADHPDENPEACGRVVELRVLPDEEDVVLSIQVRLGPSP